MTDNLIRLISMPYTKMSPLDKWTLILYFGIAILPLVIIYKGTMLWYEDYQTKRWLELNRKMIKRMRENEKYDR